MMVSHPDKVFMCALNRLLKIEGGWSDDPYDSGGKTKFGVTESTWKRFNGGTPPYPIAQITQDDAARVYYKLYWCDVGLQALLVPYEIKLEIFDAVIHGGGVMLVQRAYNVVKLPSSTRLDEDGSLGPKTRAALERFCLRDDYCDALLGAMRGERYIRFKEIFKNRPSQLRYVRGWCKRLV